jgi:hypothetical protein
MPSPCARRRPHDARVVRVALGDQDLRAARLLADALDEERQLLQKRRRRAIDQRVHRVQPQAVDAEVAQPLRGVVQQERAHAVAAGTVEVDRVAPRRLRGVGEVGPEARQVVPVRSEVVVDDVQDHGEPARVARVDQPHEPLRAAVRAVRRVELHAVVAPSARAGELGDGHQLDVRHAEVQQVVEVLRDAVERSRGAERADVQLVDQSRRQRRRREAVVAPAERRQVDDLGQPVRPVGLRPRPRIGQRVRAVQREAVARAGARRRHVRMPPAVGRRGHGVPRAVDDDVDAARDGRPQVEPDAVGGGHAGHDASRSSSATGKRASRRATRGAPS